jgi:hypothetical protein
MRKTRFFAAAAVALFALAGTAAAHPVDPEQHGPTSGHLPPTSANMQLVGKVNVSNFGPSRTADVAAFGNYAYLAWRNTGPCDPGRVNIVNISNPANPTEVGAITFPAASYPGEGMQVVRLNTTAFKGDVLVTNNENCNTTAATRVGGFSLYDVTNPLAPQSLAIGKGDTNNGALPRANQYHSAFAWQQGRRAFLIGVDNAEPGISDVDVFEITDPRNPVLVEETGLPNWPAAQQPLANGSQPNLHDMVVRNVRGRWLGLLSYWDAGWVILDFTADPTNPVFVRDSDYFEPERELGFTPAEGNAHQAEWNRNARYIVGTDEDFAPFRVKFQITTGPNAALYQAGEFSFTPPIATKFPGGLQGPTIWGGSGCAEDTDGNGTSDRDEVPAASTLPANAGEAKIVVFTRGTCFFSDKIRTGELKGYDAVIVGQSHTASGLGARPEGFTCGAQGSPVAGTASAICIGHRATHLLFNDTPEYTPGESTFPDTSFGPGADIRPIGKLGERVRAETTYDGWGYVRLLDANTLAEIDTYAVSEGVNPAFATGFGTLSVHEVATDPDRADLAYLSYYDAGMRTIRIGAGGIAEVGRYIATGGNDFWGVEAHRLPGDVTETTYILGSDRDSGLWIFRYTGG